MCCIKYNGLLKKWYFEIICTHFGFLCGHFLTLVLHHINIIITKIIPDAIRSSLFLNLKQNEGRFLLLVLLGHYYAMPLYFSRQTLQ